MFFLWWANSFLLRDNARDQNFSKRYFFVQLWITFLD